MMSTGVNEMRTEPVPRKVDARKRAGLRMRQAGYSLLELLIVLGVVGGLGLLVLARSGTVDVARQVEQFETDIGFLASGVRKVAYQGGSYGVAVISSTTLINSGAIPTTLIVGANVQNVFGGNFTITGNSSTVYLDSDTIPQTACIQIMTGLPAGTSFTGVAAAVANASLTAVSFPTAMA